MAAAGETRALAGGPGTGANVDIRRFGTRVHVASAATEGATCVLVHTLPPGCVALPMHRHAAMEVLHVLAGTLRLELERDSYVLPPGASAVIPAGAWHTVWTEPDAAAPTRFLAVCTPGGMDAYYAAVSAHVPAAGAAGVPDIAAIQAVSEQLGVEVDLLSLYDLVERYGIELS